MNDKHGTKHGTMKFIHSINFGDFSLIISIVSIRNSTQNRPMIKSIMIFVQNAPDHCSDPYMRANLNGNYD